MIFALAVALATASLALAAWSLLGALLKRRPSGPQLVGIGVVEVGLLVQAVIGVLALVRGGHQTSGLVFAGYLLASVLLLPVGTAWGIADRSRWGNGVLAIACAAVAVVVLRLLQVWG